LIYNAFKIVQKMNDFT